MTPTGYFRKIEALLRLVREEALHPETIDAEKHATAISNAATAADQAWNELSQEDRELVFNIAQQVVETLGMLAKPIQQTELSRIILTH